MANSTLIRVDIQQREGEDDDSCNSVEDSVETF